MLKYVNPEVLLISVLNFTFTLEVCTEKRCVDTSMKCLQKNANIVYNLL